VRSVAKADGSSEVQAAHSDGDLCKVEAKRARSVNKSSNGARKGARRFFGKVDGSNHAVTQRCMRKK